MVGICWARKARGGHPLPSPARGVHAPTADGQAQATFGEVHAKARDDTEAAPKTERHGLISVNGNGRRVRPDGRSEARTPPSWGTAAGRGRWRWACGSDARRCIESVRQFLCSPMTVGCLRACRRGSNQRRALKAFLIQMIARRARSLVVCSDSVAMCSRDLPSGNCLGFFRCGRSVGIKRR